jgi:hypothetical protein
MANVVEIAALLRKHSELELKSVRVRLPYRPISSN